MKKQNQTKPWTITAKASGEIEILLYEMIGQDFWTGEGTTAKAFAEDLKAAGKVSKIHLRVNSPGGSVFDGIAIYNTLLSHGATVTAQVDGIAASIASVIIMAASEISMGDNAMMMIHNPATMIGGDANKMRKMADTMDKVKTSMITAYRRHTSKSIEEVGALMDVETWMTAQEAVDSGFAEKVTTPEGDAADVAANFDLSVFRKVPQQIAARFAGTRPPRAAAAAGECGCDCTGCMKDDCASCTNSNCTYEDCEDCPMQEEKTAKAAWDSSRIALETRAQKAETALTAQTERATTLETRAQRAETALAVETNRATTLETDLATEKKARASGEGERGKWMARVSGDLEKAETVFQALGEELAGRQTAGKGNDRLKLLQGGLAEIVTAVTEEKTARAAEMAALRRMGSDAEKATGSFGAVQTGLATAGDHPNNARLTTLEETLAPIVEALTEEQTARASDAAAVQRIGADIAKASEMFGSVQAELVRRQHPAMAEVAVDRLKGLAEKLTKCVASLTEEKTARAADGEWVAALSEEIAAAIASLTQESAREKAACTAADSDRLAHASDTVTKAIEAFTAVQAAVTQFATISASTIRTKRVDGENLTSECFLWVGDAEKTETWALPWRFSSEEKTESHLRDALARFDQEEKIPASEKPAVHARLVKLCKEHGITVNEKDAKAMAAALEAAAGTDPFKGMEETLGALAALAARDRSWQAAEAEWLQSVMALIEKVGVAPVTELAAALASLQTEVSGRHTTVAGSLDARMKPREDKLAQVTDLVAAGRATLATNGERLESKLAAALQEKALLRVNAECFSGAVVALLSQTASALGAVQTEVTTKPAALPSAVIDNAKAALGSVQAKVASHTARPEIERLKAVEDTLAGFSAAVTEEKNARTAEVAWPKRMSAEVDQSAAAFKGAHTELGRRQFAGEAAVERLQKLGEELVAIVALIAEEKTARAGATVWTKTVGGEVEQLARVFKDLRAELGRREHPAEAAIERLKSVEEKLAGIAAAVTEETSARASDAEALAGMNARLKEAGAVLTSANAELGRRARISAISS